MFLIWGMIDGKVLKEVVFDGMFLLLFKLLCEGVEVWINVIKYLEIRFIDIFLVIYFKLGI